MQNFWGYTKCIMNNVEVASRFSMVYIDRCHFSEYDVINTNEILVFVSVHRPSA